jgi:hypothetical protein
LDLPQETLDRLGLRVRRTSLRETDDSGAIRPFAGKGLPGCGNVLMAREAFAAVGVFDVLMTRGGSDCDFFRRAKAAGLAMYYSPHAVIRHRIPPNRLTPEYIRWDAQQGCDVLASHVFHDRGRLGLAVLCAARIAQALLIVLPRLVLAALHREEGAVLGEKMQLWRTEGFVRRTLTILLPPLFPQRRYFADLDFRRGRQIGQKTTPTGATS